MVRREQRGVNVTGAELIEAGFKDGADGKPLRPKEEYRVKAPVTAEVNHYRKMKKIMRTHGLMGVASYGNAIIDIDIENRLAKANDELAKAESENQDETKNQQ